MPFAEFSMMLEVQVRTAALFGASIGQGHSENPLRAADGGSLTTLEVESQVECKQ